MWFIDSSRHVRKSSFKRIHYPFFAHGFSFHVDGVSVVHESVEDGIGEGGVADDFMPLFDWQLRGDEGRTQAMSVVEDVEQVAALLGIECREPPVIEDEEVGFGELGEVLGIGAVAASDGDVGQKAWDAEVAGGEAIATGAVGDGTGEEGFADAGGPGDEDIEVVV